MEKIFVFAIGLLAITACKKSNNPPTNIVTTIDNGTTYTGNVNVQCAIDKTTVNSVFSLSSSSSSGYPVSFQMKNVDGPLNSVGVYTAKGIDSTRIAMTNQYLTTTNCTFTETFANGEDYTVDSVMVNITQAEGETILGNYEMWLTNSSGNKTITGSINCTNATIN